MQQQLCHCMIHDLNNTVLGGLQNNIGSNFCLQLDISNEDQNPPLSLHNCSFEDMDKKIIEDGIKIEVWTYSIGHSIYDIRKVDRNILPFLLSH